MINNETPTSELTKLLRSTESRSKQKLLDEAAIRLELCEKIICDIATAVFIVQKHSDKLSKEDLMEINNAIAEELTSALNFEIEDEDL